MKNYKYYIRLTQMLLLGTILFSSCERELSEDAVFATYPNIAEVFTDNPVNLTDQFFESFDPATGANTEGFGVDENEFYEGTTSIRIDVPASNDPNGNFIGGIFKDRGEGRNLTEYNALTFYAKGSVSGTIGTVGFGSDFEDGIYPVSVNNLQLTTGWKKYIIPIPDPSRLTQEKGMFLFSAGGFDVIDNIPNGNEVAWTFWLDEIKFEDLGAIGQDRPAIMNGVDTEQLSFNGVTTSLSGLTATYNLPTGDDVTVNVAPSFYEFESSNTSVAIVNQFGEVSVLSAGEAVITGILNGVGADGSLIINSVGEFNNAPVPTRPAANVVSIFSDAYNNVPVDYYNGFFAPFQTTLGGAINVAGDNIINYTDLNFVAIGTFLNVPNVDLSNMTHLHVDLNVQEQLDPSDFMRLEINCFINGNEVGASYTINSSELISQDWASFDIPLSDFVGDNPGLANRSNAGLYFFVSDATISNLYVDNYYFYSE